MKISRYPPTVVPRSVENLKKICTTDVKFDSKNAKIHPVIKLEKIMKSLNLWA